MIYDHLHTEIKYYAEIEFQPMGRGTSRSNADAIIMTGAGRVGPTCRGQVVWASCIFIVIIRESG